MLWLDANNSASIEITDSKISKWNDLTSFENDVIQTSAGARPIVSGSTLNSLPLIEFGGSAFLEKTTFAYPASSTMFIVFEAETIDSSEDAIISFDATDKDFDLEAGLATSFKGSYNSSGIETSGDSATEINSSSVTGFHIWAINLNETESNGFQAWMDGTQKSQFTPYADIATSGTLRLFLNRAGTEYLEGKIAECLIVNSTMDTTLRQKTEGYFAHKWGLTSLLPVGHPYKTTQANGCYHGDPCFDTPFCQTYQNADGDEVRLKFDFTGFYNTEIGGVWYSQGMWSASVISGFASPVSLTNEYVSGNPISSAIKWTLVRQGLADYIWYSVMGACPSSDALNCPCDIVCTTTSTTTLTPTTSTSSSSTTLAPTTSTSSSTSSTSSSTSSSTTLAPTTSTSSSTSSTTLAPTTSTSSSTTLVPTTSTSSSTTLVPTTSTSSSTSSTTLAP